MGQALGNCCSPEEEIHLFRKKRPALTPNSRVIRIVLDKCTDLPASDAEMFGGKSDPYVSFQFGKQRRRTDVIDSTLNPEWKQQEYEFIVTEADVREHKLLKIKVMDHDPVTADDLLAEIDFDMTQWTGATRLKDMKQQAYDLRAPECYEPQNVNPQIHLAIAFLNQWEAAARITEEIWENERWLNTTQTWSKNNLTFGDRHAWTSSDNKLAGPNFKAALPAIPDGFVQEGQWQYDISHGDQNGWVYAFSFKGPWRKEKSALTLVRRRLWFTHYNRTAEVEPEPAAQLEF